MSSWSSPFPEHLDVVDCSYVSGMDLTTINFLLGGRRFDLICSGALFPTAVSAVDFWPPGGELKSIFCELAKLLRLFCGKQLVDFNRKNASLADVLHVWNVDAYTSDGRFQLGSPTRGQRIDELFNGVEYRDVDLPWYDWESITVLERMSETHFLVRVHDRRFGCYVPEGAFEYEGYSIFLQEVQAWKRISNTPGIPRSIPRITGLVNSHLGSSKLQGVLYEWVDPSTTIPSLSQMKVERVPMEQRRALFRQIESAVLFLRAGRASLTRRGCKGEIGERITITTDGEAHLRRIHFGSVEICQGSFRFKPHEEADDWLLAELRSFLRVDHGSTTIAPEPFKFLQLPAEVRNEVYELLLAFPGLTRWLWGYRHQENTSTTMAGFAHSEIAGRGLLCTNRQIRRESLSFLISRNNLLLDAVWLASFLESSTQVDVGGSLQRIRVGSYLRQITLTITLTWQERVTHEQSKGIKELMRCCPHLKNVDLLIYNRRAWYWESDALWADIMKLPNVRVEEHWDDSVSFDQIHTGTTLRIS